MPGERKGRWVLIARFPPVAVKLVNMRLMCGNPAIRQTLGALDATSRVLSVLGPSPGLARWFNQPTSYRSQRDSKLVDGVKAGIGTMFQPADRVSSNPRSFG